ncbi:MAG: DUF3466 family protein [Pseudomonadota bacterium]
MKELPTGALKAGQPTAINNAGQVVGIAFSPGPGPYRNVLWEEGALLAIFPSAPQGINDLGVVVGNNFLWSKNGGFRPLGPRDGGRRNRAWGINNAGLVVGLVNVCVPCERTGQTVPCLWPDPWRWPKSFVPLVPEENTDARAAAANDAGVIAGRCFSPAFHCNRAACWKPGPTGYEMRFLASPGNGYSEAEDLNENDEIVGGAMVEATTAHAFIWRPDGSARDLGAPADNHASWAEGINNQGVVVGFGSVPHTTESYAFMWTEKDGLVDLNKVISTDSGWVLERAVDVNDQGQIVGYGSLRGEAMRPFILTPLSLTPLSAD